MPEFGHTIVQKGDLMSNCAVPTGIEAAGLLASLSAGGNRAEQALVRLFPHLDVDAVTQLSLAADEPPRALDPEGFWTMVHILEGRAVFALRTFRRARLRIEDGPWAEMQRVGDTSLVFATWAFSERRTYSYSLRIDDLYAGTGDFAAYGPASFPSEGVADGLLSGPYHVESQIYLSATTTYWLYANAGVDADVASPAMIWHDGEGYLDPADGYAHRLKIVSDNLVAAGTLPPMVHVLVSPSAGGRQLPLQYEGQTQQSAMRSLQYDTVSETYGRHLLDEVLPDVGRHYALRADGYSRATAGLSSGGICAFTLSWFHPADFARAMSGIGSFTGLRWEPGQLVPGGFLYPFLIRRNPPKNIRAWISDGSWDVDVGEPGRADMLGAGSWPLANLSLIQALAARRYDFEFRFGTAGHNAAQTGLDLPEALSWLWRDYDPAKKYQAFAAERERRPLRVRLVE
jgi:hypothetical protein